MENEEHVEQVPAEHDQSAEESHDTSTIIPRGAFTFVILMIIAYALYWAFIWFTVMGRGAGG